MNPCYGTFKWLSSAASSKSHRKQAQMPQTSRNHQLFRGAGEEAGSQLCCSVTPVCCRGYTNNQFLHGSLCFFLDAFTAIILDSFVYYVYTMPIATTSCWVVAFLRFSNVGVQKNQLACWTASECLPTNPSLQNLENSLSIQLCGIPGCALQDCP